MNRELPEIRYQHADLYNPKDFNELGLDKDFVNEYALLRAYAHSNRTNEQFSARLADLKQRQGVLLRTYHEHFGLPECQSESERQLDAIIDELNSRYDNKSLTRDDVRRMTDSIDELIRNTKTH